MKKDPTQLTHRERIERAINYINEHIGNDVCLEKTATYAYYSKYHFHRIFKAFTNESFKEYIRRIRLERAARELRFSDKAITTIAFESGYENAENFSRAFKNRFQLGPRAFRNSNKALAISASLDESVFEPKSNMKAVTLVNRAKCKVAYVHHIGPYHQCGTAWDAVCAAVGKQGYFDGNNEFIGISYDDPEVTPADKLRYDACVSIDENFVASEKVSTKYIDGGEFARFSHQGPYEKLSDTYYYIYKTWLASSERELADRPPLEVYLNDPDSTDPEDLLTDIYIALQ